MGGAEGSSGWDQRQKWERIPLSPLCQPISLFARLFLPVRVLSDSLQEALEIKLGAQYVIYKAFLHALCHCQLTVNSKRGKSETKKLAARATPWTGCKPEGRQVGAEGGKQGNVPSALTDQPPLQLHRMCASRKHLPVRNKNNNNL